MMMRSRDVSHTTKMHNKRKRMPMRSDGHVFSETADKSRVENSRKNPMRGGFRM